MRSPGRPAKLGLMVACGAFVGCLEGVEPEPPLPPDQAVLVVHELVLEDPSRATPSIGDLEGADSRVLEVDVWVGPHVAEGADARPLVLLLHGLDGHPSTLTGVARHLVSAEMVVALIRFPVTASDASGSLGGVGDFPEQPGDVSFVIDELTAEQTVIESGLYRRFDPDRVAVVGHSLGGSTALALTHFRDTLDPRIDVVVAIAPASPVFGLYFGVPILDPAGAPAAIAVGEDDPIHSDSEQLYDQLDPPRALLSIPGVGHTEPITGDEEPISEARALTQELTERWIREYALGQSTDLAAWFSGLDDDYTTRLDP